MKNKILIVDDDESNLSILNARLKDIYEIKIAYDGPSALKIIEKVKDIDLILLDIQMPIMDGFEVAFKLQSSPNTKDIPIIFLTAKDDDEAFIKGFDVGAKDFISKPFRQKELEIRIKNHLTQFIQKKQIEIQNKELLNREKLLSEYLIYSETDINGIITKASKTFCEISEYTEEELIGYTHNIVRHPDTKDEVFADLWETIESGKVWRGEIKNITKNGHYYWVYATISPKYDENNNLVGYVSLRQDITSKKDFENQEKRLNEESRNLSLKELIGNIAHHWRQPLSVITTTASGMKIEHEYGIFDMNQLDVKLDEIVNSAFYLSNTIDEFSSFINSDNNLEKISVKDELKTVLTLMNSVILTNSIHIKKLYEDKKDATIYTHKKDLTQALINIINNAKDAMQNNKTEDKIIVIDYEIIDDKVIISTEDYGSGISDENLPKIFDPYFTTKHKSQGKGLSLYTSFNAVTQILKGNLYAKNTEHGTKFFIELPM